MNKVLARNKVLACDIHATKLFLGTRTKNLAPTEVGSRDSDMNLRELERNCQIKDKHLLIKCGVVLFATIVLFCLSNFPLFNLSLGWTALLGSLTLLVLADKIEVESIFAR